MKASAGKTKKEKKSGTTGKIAGNGLPKRTPWTFPKNTLEEAINVAKAIEEKNAGNPMPSKALVSAVGFRQSTDWRYLDLLRSSNLYGLTEGGGANGTINLTKLGQDIVAPSSPKQRGEALFSAFKNVKDFEAVNNFYSGKQIPEDEFFLNTLTREFNIPRDRVENFAKIFLDNRNYVGSFVMAPSIDTVSGASEKASNSIKSDGLVSQKEVRPREFLDTCFVMMPFGEWFDRYYQEIYIPAIREAGFEPKRADELFSTGSVVEQIWEQIAKAKVLLADLSGKNPNVFYELGLAHAAKKPVVFTASKLDDIPFDLRHLRIIVYDIREPEWATILKKSIADYLRNASKEPEKSIPHPFRKVNGDAESN